MLAALIAVSPVEALPDDDIADIVFGQDGNLAARECNNGGISASSLCEPFGVTVDGDGNVYMADTINNRVLVYLNVGGVVDDIADVVFGQADFTSRICNENPSADTLCSPVGLYVADQLNDRVLVYEDPIDHRSHGRLCIRPAGLRVRDLQPGAGVGSPPDDDTLCFPVGVAVDGDGNVYVADYNNNRVLVYFDPLSEDLHATTADLVFGQADFTSGICNRGAGVGSPPDDDTLCGPTDVALDAGGRLYVSDRDNHRVLIYEEPLSGNGAATADIVFGQNGDFTTAVCNKGGSVTANTLCHPFGVDVDIDANLYVSDSNNHRVLVYLDMLVAPPDTTADFVFGQNGNLAAQECRNGGISAFSLCEPLGVAVDGDGNLYVADRANHRALVYLEKSPRATYWQCFNLTDGDDPKRSLTLSTEFGDDSVVVRRATRLCETATKNGGGIVTPEFYLCYTITGGMDPKANVTLETGNFGEDEVVVRASTTMCESAQKKVNGNYVGSLLRPSQQCFNLTGGMDPKANVTLETDNFGEDGVVVRASSLMCAGAVVGGGDLEETRRQCFNLTGGIDPNSMVELRTERHGEDTVRVRAATIMCEGATPNQPPVAEDDSYGPFDCNINVSAPGVLANDHDPDNRPLPLTVELVDDSFLGTLTLNPDGSFSYSSGSVEIEDGFTYRAFDGADYSNVAIVTLSGICLS